MKAVHSWQSSMDTAQNLCDENLHKDALPFLGCAFEASEIILTTKAVEIEKATELFAKSAVMFAGACARLGYMTEALEIYWMFIHRIERELSVNSSSQKWINQHLTYFYESVQNSDFFGERSEFFLIAANHNSQISEAFH